MTRKLLAAALAAMMLLTFFGCGKEETPATTVEATPLESYATTGTLGLADWSLSASTWSSPNGATIHLAAVPNYYNEDLTAAFVVRLEGDEVASIPCLWDGSYFTASADLNGADGYCYYVQLADKGEALEVAVNTPSVPVNEAFINMRDALNSFCDVLVNDSSFDGKTLTITDGTARIQAPRIADMGKSIVCDKAELALLLAGEEVGRVALTVSEMEEEGLYILSLKDVSFQIPQLEDDQILNLQLDVALSNGQLLNGSGCDWYYNDGQLLLAVG